MWAQKAPFFRYDMILLAWVSLEKLSGKREDTVAGRTGNIRKYIPLVQELVLRDLRLKYRRSVLGYLWSLLNPLMMMALMNIVFSYMFRFDIPNYPIYLICGQTLCNFFTESTTMAMHSVIQNASLLKKVYIPKYIFPIARVTSGFVTMAFSLLAVVIVMLATRTPFHLSILLFWGPLAMLFLFSCGVGMAISALAVQFRDITHLYSVLTMAWVYLTPIFYPISAVPESVAAIIRMNPLYIFITIFRELVLYGNIPAWDMWFSGSAVAVGAVVIGTLLFQKMQDRFILYI